MSSISAFTCATIHTKHLLLFHSFYIFFYLFLRVNTCTSDDGSSIISSNSLAAVLAIVLLLLFLCIHVNVLLRTLAKYFESVSQSLVHELDLRYIQRCLRVSLAVLLLFFFRWCDGFIIFVLIFRCFFLLNHSLFCREYIRCNRLCDKMYTQSAVCGCIACVLLCYREMGFCISSLFPRFYFIHCTHRYEKRCIFHRV